MVLGKYMIMKIYRIIQIILSYIVLCCYKIKYHNNLYIGKGSSIYRKSLIRIDSSSAYIKIGEQTLIGRSKRGYHSAMPFYTTLFVDTNFAHIEIGNNCRINGAYIHSQKKIVIGNNCVIAAGVNIFDSNGHVVKSNDRTRGRDIAQELIIGNNVWIGVNAIILKGTVIGDNSVIAAGSVVKGIFPNNSIIMGNPSKLIKQWK